MTSRKNEQTSPAIAKLAAQGLKNPASLTPAQVQKLAGSVLTQTPDRPTPKPKAPARKPSPRR